MQTEQYRANLKEALSNLEKVNESIFNSMIDIIMQSDLKEWNDMVPIGEIHQFDFDIFKNSSDTNIQLLAELIEKVDATYQTIRNINSIQLGEQND